jgi:ribulose-phosphate 3-epimerase
MSKLAPSILSADFNRLGENIKAVENEGVKILHIDVMDGCFVPSISFGMPLIKSIRRETDIFFDVHLMVNEPIRYIEDFKNCGADSITIHKEACQDPINTLKTIRKLGLRCGVAVNPETDIEQIQELLPFSDMVLVMTVHPGFGGQKMINEALKKVSILCEMRKKGKLSFQIEVDGGVNKENIETVVKIGTDIIVAGTAVFKGNIKY